MPNKNKVIAGIDGCKGGWLCIVKTSTGKINAYILEDVSKILTLNPKPEIVAIDIPIGLADKEPRICDLEARKKLGKPRSCSVFPAPARATLKATSHQKASDINQKITGRRLSIQTYGILEKIKEVDTFMQEGQNRQTWVREVHPELCFWEWNDQNSMKHKKGSTDGRKERKELIVGPCGFGSAYDLAQLELKELHRGQYKNDDLLDAFAALWTAERIRTLQHYTIPKNPPTDSCGLRMEMVI